MNVVNVFYDHRVDGEELVAHEKNIRLYSEACEVIDLYPWKTEVEWFEKLGVGGGFQFTLGDDKVFARYQFTPVDEDEGFLLFDLVLEPGFLNFFGRKSVSENFNAVSKSEAKVKIKELFDYSIASLYEKYKG